VRIRTGWVRQAQQVTHGASLKRPDVFMDIDINILLQYYP
jgi:hypothetical protein